LTIGIPQRDLFTGFAVRVPSTIITETAQDQASAIQSQTTGHSPDDGLKTGFFNEIDVKRTSRIVAANAPGQSEGRPAFGMNRRGIPESGGF
jgi:hypothetical protein